MESLYYLTLTHLRNHQHLLTDNLNYTVKNDLKQIIKDKNYLRTFLQCRIIYNWDTVYSYIVKYSKDTTYVASLPTNKVFDLSNAPSYIEDYFITAYNNIYQLSSKTIYCVVNLYCYKFEYRLVPKTDYISGFLNKDINTVINEEFFDAFPGLLHWMETNNYISERLILEKNKLYPA